MLEEIFKNPFFLPLLICGLISFIGGINMKKNPPKNINYFYGYRTVNSMKSQERWDFAQVFAAKKMRKYGKYLMIIAFIGLPVIIFIPIGFLVLTILMLIIILIVISVMIFQVEKAIKKKFRK